MSVSGLLPVRGGAGGGDADSVTRNETITGRKSSCIFLETKEKKNRIILSCVFFSLMR